MPARGAISVQLLHMKLLLSTSVQEMQAIHNSPKPILCRVLATRVLLRICPSIHVRCCFATTPGEIENEAAKVSKVPDASTSVLGTFGLSILLLIIFQVI